MFRCCVTVPAHALPAAAAPNQRHHPHICTRKPARSALQGAHAICGQLLLHSELAAVCGAWRGRHGCGCVARCAERGVGNALHQPGHSTSRGSRTVLADGSLDGVGANAGHTHGADDDGGVCGLVGVDLVGPRGKVPQGLAGSGSRHRGWSVTSGSQQEEQVANAVNVQSLD